MEIAATCLVRVVLRVTLVWDSSVLCAPFRTVCGCVCVCLAGATTVSETGT